MRLKTITSIWVQNIFITPELLAVTLSSPSLSPADNHTCFLSLWICLYFQTFHTNGIIQYLAFSGRFLHSACSQGSLTYIVAHPLLTEYSIVWHVDILSTHKLMDFRLFLPLLPHTSAIVRNAATGIYAQIFVWRYVSSSLKNIPRRATGGSHGKCMFDHLRNCLTGSANRLHC